MHTVSHTHTHTHTHIHTNTNTHTHTCAELTDGRGKDGCERTESSEIVFEQSSVKVRLGAREKKLK